MAARYVYSGAGGAGTGADWANAHTTFSAAITAGAAGDVYYVAHDHAQSTASAVTLTFKGTAASPDRVLCVNRAGSVPPVAADLTTGASVTTTGNSALTLNGNLYCYGVTFNCGTGGVSPQLNVASSAGDYAQHWDTCAFNIVATGASAVISLVGGVSRALLTNCTMSFGATGQKLGTGLGVVEIRSKPGSTFVTGATVPTTLLRASTSNGGPAPLFSGLDLSAFGSGKSLCVADLFNSAVTVFVNCKLDASVGIMAGTVSAPYDGGVDIIGCHSTTNAARNERYRYMGTLTTETTIKRTGGASDGTTSYSWKIVTNANNERDFPFETFEGVIWNETLSSQTLTIHTVTDNVTLTDAEAWVEVEYLASSATPVASLITDANATVLTTPANQASSSETWTTTGLTTPVKQALSVTFTAGMVGPIRWRVKVGKASTTVYVCPKAELA